MKINQFPTLALVAVASLVLAACGDDDSNPSTDNPDVIGDTPSDTGSDPGGDTGSDTGSDVGGDTGSDIGGDTGGDTPIPQPKARIRAIHLSPDAPAVDLFANDAEPAAVTNLAFPEGTGYLELPQGQYNFDLSPAGAGLASSVLDTGKLDLLSGKSYTAFAYDAVASLKVGLIEDDFENLGAGKIRVRAIHAAAGVGQVDIWNLPSMGDPAPLYPDFDFGAVGSYLDLPAGSYRLGFDVNNDATPDLIFQTPDLPAGTVANVFAVQKDGAVFLIAQLNDGTTARIDPLAAPARIRAIHLSPDAPAVDIFANDASPAAVTNLAFPDGTGYLELPQGQYNFDLSPTGAGLASSVLDTGKLDLLSGKSYTAFAYDAVASLKVGLIEDDFENLGAGKIRVRAIHAAAGVGQVDIWNLPSMGDPAPLYPDFDFGAVGSYLDLPAGSYRLGFDVNNDATPDLIFQTPALPAGTVANVFAVQKDGAVFLIAQLNDGTTARIDPEVLMP